MKVLFYCLISFCLFSCSKSEDCELTNSKCEEKAPDGTTCQAYFESWLYNKDSKSCEYKDYSGCNKIGFETKEECEKCKCY